MPAHLIIIINDTYPPVSLYEAHILMAAKKVLKRNCKHLRDTKGCGHCVEHSPKDNTCKIGIPCTWK